MTESENENDHFDLDHFDHILAMIFCEKQKVQIICMFQTFFLPLQQICKHNLHFQ